MKRPIIRLGHKADESQRTLLLEQGLRRNRDDTSEKSISPTSLNSSSDTSNSSHGIYQLTEIA